MSDCGPVGMKEVLDALNSKSVPVIAIYTTSESYVTKVFEDAVAESLNTSRLWSKTNKAIQSQFAKPPKFSWNDVFERVIKKLNLSGFKGKKAGVFLAAQLRKNSTAAVRKQRRVIDSTLITEFAQAILHFAEPIETVRSGPLSSIVASIVSTRFGKYECWDLVRKHILTRYQCKFCGTIKQVCRHMKSTLEVFTEKLGVSITTTTQIGVEFILRCRDITPTSTRRKSSASSADTIVDLTTDMVSTAPTFPSASSLSEKASFVATASPSASSLSKKASFVATASIGHSITIAQPPRVIEPTDECDEDASTGLQKAAHLYKFHIVKGGVNGCLRIQRRKGSDELVDVFFIRNTKQVASGTLRKSSLNVHKGFCVRRVRSKYFVFHMGDFKTAVGTLRAK